MDVTLIRASIVLAVALIFGAHAARTLVARRRAAAALELLGAAGLLLVALAHFAEARHLLPFMGWGQEHSPGHYLDLASAITALILLPVGLAAEVVARRHG